MSVLDDMFCNNENLNSLEDDNIEDDYTVEDDDIQCEKVKPKYVMKKEWVLTDNRKVALKKGRDIRDENARVRIANRELKIQEEMKKYEEIVLKKALSIRKRQIKNDYLSRIEDDNTDENEIQNMRQKLNNINSQQLKKPTQQPIIQTTIRLIDQYKFVG